MQEAILALAVTIVISGGLALVILVADALLLNYGECTVTVNNDKQIKLQGGGSLLAALRDEKVFIPSACGGRGSCGLCKVKVLSGGGQLLPTEDPYLSPEEIRDNVRLSCQIKIRNDLVIEIPPELLSVREFGAVVEKIIELNYDTRRLRLKLPPDESVKFVPGQYIQFTAPAYGGNPDPVYRAYSIASPVTDTSAIELIVRRAPNGICTTYIFEILQEGDTVLINGPYGEFYLRDTDAEILLIAGGSGIAPFISMLHQIRDEKITRKTTFFYGANTLKDLYLVEEMRQLDEEIPNFTYIPVVAQPEGEWEGETGFVTNALDRHVTDASDKEAYLCGSPGMIDATIKVLESKGMPKTNIFYDKFV